MVKLVALITAEYLPASQSVQEDAAWPEYLPATQDAHVVALVAPVAAEYLPATQDVHVLELVAPVDVEYFP